MPFLAPLLPVLIPAAVSGVTAGLQLSGAGTGSPQADANAQLQKQEQQQAAQAQIQQQNLIKANLANQQDQTGGNVLAPNLVDLTAIVSGLPGAVNTASTTNALNAFLGTPNTPQQQDNLVSSTYGLSGGQG